MIKRRLLPLIATLALLSSLCGCFILPQPVTPPSPTKYRYEFLNNWQYRYLSQEERDCYGSIYTALTDEVAVDETVTIGDDKSIAQQHPGIQIRLPHPVQSQEDMARLYNAFFRDNPHFFYVSNTYGMLGYSIKEQTYYDTLVLAYTIPAAQRTEAIAHLETAVTSLLTGRPDTTDQYLTELFVHDRLALACTYDYTAAEQGYESNPAAYTAYGALVDGTAVCEGYARAMQLLLKRCGIHSTLVTGQSLENHEQHMWNLVTVNDCNYHLDLTWDDAEDLLRHTYLNITSEQLIKTHRIDEGQTGIDTCSMTTDNFFFRNRTYVDTYERQAIATMIAARVSAGDTTVELSFSDDTFDNGLLFLKNATLTAKMVNPLLNGETKALWDYDLTGDMAQHTLTLTKREN